MSIELRCGRWEDVLGDVECVDLLCSDPPYGARTHGGQRHGRKDARYCDPSLRPNLSARGIEYAAWTADDVDRFVDFWAPRTTGWFCAFTSHDLVPAYASALELNDRYVFAPIACVQHGMNVRLAGDGPSNWTTWLVVARPRSMRHWGTLPGAYVGAPHDEHENTFDRSKRPVPGGKPIWLMRSVIRDYSKPGDLVCDPCGGGFTTALAAAIEGRRAISAEMDPVTFAKGKARVERGYTPSMFTSEPRKPPEQEALSFDEDQGPYVCPGCHAIGAEPHPPHCPDAAIEADRERDRECDDESEPWDTELERYPGEPAP